MVVVGVGWGGVGWGGGGGVGRSEGIEGGRRGRMECVRGVWDVGVVWGL